MTTWCSYSEKITHKICVQLLKTKEIGYVVRKSGEINSELGFFIFARILMKNRYFFLRISNKDIKATVKSRKEMLNSYQQCLKEKSSLIDQLIHTCTYRFARHSASCEDYRLQVFRERSASSLPQILHCLLWWHVFHNICIVSTGLFK